MPVFEDERRLAKAWLSGGIEAEKHERELMRQEARDKERRNLKAFDEMLENGRKQRESELTTEDPASLVNLEDVEEESSLLDTVE
jgi:dynein assembly factor 1